jgi:hypothetical protein
MVVMLRSTVRYLAIFYLTAPLLGALSGAVVSLSRAWRDGNPFLAVAAVLVGLAAVAVFAGLVWVVWWASSPRRVA